MTLTDWQAAHRNLLNARESYLYARTRNQLHTASKAIFAAKNDLAKAYFSLFAPGDVVAWKHGERTRVGYILSIHDPMNERVQILGVTRGHYWISVASLIDHRPMFKHQAKEG